MRSRIAPLATVVVALALAGCANGDFGEVKPSLVTDGIHDWVAADATGSVPSSGFELTADERELRDLAYPLVEPPYLRHTPESVLREYGWLPGQYHSGDDTTAYATFLLSWPVRFPNARYARLIDDIRNDTTRLSQFFETAAKVVDIDRKRRKSIALIPVSSPAERADAERRVIENAAIVTQVRASLDRRVASYRFALERLVIMTPDTQAAQAELALDQLKAALASYQTGAPLRRMEGGSLGRAAY